MSKVEILEELPKLTTEERKEILLKLVEQAVRNVCDYRLYILRAINVRRNHAHVLVTAARKPELLLEAFNSYSTRALRKAGAISQAFKPWIRHGSTIYLWKERDVAKAIEYVVLGQGDELFRLDGNYALPDGRATGPPVEPPYLLFTPVGRHQIIRSVKSL
jgi:REP element-mobilizing transposase RayT